MSRPILVTGAAGFIGFHAARRLLESGAAVVGIDSFSPYYDPRLKERRFAELTRSAGFVGRRLNLAVAADLRALFAEYRFERVVHLAAQPGVRYALTHPEPYAESNLDGFLNLLEACRHGDVQHLVYASSSSVYGSNVKLPFAETDPVDHPISLYAATKRANELMAHAYAHLFELPVTGLRFFTVYGPWGRPDMAIYTFTDRIARGLPIDVAAGGSVRRDFTYVADVAQVIERLVSGPDLPAPASDRQESRSPDRSTAPFRIFNVGGDRPVDLNTVIGLIEAALGRRALRREVELPPGDVEETRADTTALRGAIGSVPETPLATGIPRFVQWYRLYHARDAGPALDSGPI